MGETQVVALVTRNIRHAQALVNTGTQRGLAARLVVHMDVGKSMRIFMQQQPASHMKP